MERNVVIALGQMQAVQGDVESNVRTMERMAAEAASGGAQIICFPELSQTGYFVGKELLSSLAEPSDGPFVRRMAACARENGIWIIAGYAQREKGSFYNSCVLIDRKGSVVGNVRKVHLWKSEKKRFQAGCEFPVFRTEFGVLSILPCYDLEFPEPARIAALKGAELIFCPAAWSVPAKNRWELDLRANSLFNLLFIAGVNYADELCCGASAVAGPDGVFLCQGPEQGETVLVAKADLSRIAQQRERIPYFEDLERELYRREWDLL